MYQKGFVNPLILITLLIVMIFGGVLIVNQYSDSDGKNSGNSIKGGPVVDQSPAPFYTTSSSKINENFITYKTQNYEMELPNTWLIEDSTVGPEPNISSELSIDLTTGSYNRKSIFFSIHEYKVADSTTLPDIYNEYFDNSVGYLIDAPKAVLIKMADLTIDSYPAVKFSSNSEGKPVDTYYATRYYIKVSDQLIYELEFGAGSQSVLVENDVLLEKLAQSFKLTK